MPNAAPVVIIKGHLKVYINDIAMFERTLQALDATSSATGGTAAHIPVYIANLASAVQHEAARRFAKPINSLREAIFEARRVLPVKVAKQWQTLNTTYSLLRHSTHHDCEAIAAQVRSCLREHGNVSDEHAREECSEGPHPWLMMGILRMLGVIERSGLGLTWFVVSWSLQTSVVASAQFFPQAPSACFQLAPSSAQWTPLTGPRVGMRVTSSQPIDELPVVLPADLRGFILDVDDEGDAMVFFPALSPAPSERWIDRNSFAQLEMCVEMAGTPR